MDIGHGGQAQAAGAKEAGRGALKVESKLSFAIALALGLSPAVAQAEFPPETGQSLHPAPGPVWQGAWPATYTLRHAVRSCKQDKKKALEEAAAAAPPDEGTNPRKWVNLDCKREVVLPEVTSGRVSVHLEVGNRYDLPPYNNPPDPPIDRYTYWYGSFNGFWPLKDGEEDNGKNLGKSDCANTCVGNPIVVNAANKYQFEVDYAGTGGRGLKFERFYNSAPEAQSVSLGVGWRHTYSRNLELHDFSPDKKTLIIHRDDGMQILFRESNGLWLPTADVRMKIKPVIEAGVPQIWELSNPADGSTETYDASGRLVAIDYDDGYRLDIAYSGGRLSQVTDAQGRVLSIARRSDGLISTVTDPAGVVYTYKYGSPTLPAWPELSDYRLDKVTATSGYAREYRYDTGSEPYRNGLLTQILDETGAVKASFSYDASGNPISTEHTGGAERYTIQPGVGGTTEVVYANGLKMRYRFTNINGRTLPLDVERICTTSDCSATASYSYDAAGYLDRVTGFDGVKDYDYNSKGQLIQRIDAPGTNVARKVQFDWHQSFDVPLERRVYDPNGNLWTKEQWTYNARGQQLTSSAIDPASGEVRTTTTTYCEAADVQAGTCPIVGLTIRVDGPRTDVNDVTTFSYYAQDDSGCSTPTGLCSHRRGDVFREVNAAGHVTEYLAYDRAGRPISVKDANGVVTDVEYDLRGQLKRQLVRGGISGSEADDSITTIEYDATGALKKATDADGFATVLEYDAAGRLTDVLDASGNRIRYTLDNEGRPEKTEVLDSVGSLAQSMSTVRNQLGWIKSIKDAYGRSTTISYHKNGSRNYTTDALGTQTIEQTDELNRPSRVILGANGSSSNGALYQYDPNDQLISAYDGMSRVTSYERNRFGEPLSLAGPATGTTVYSYDKAGNVRTERDADGRERVSTYDAIGRTISIAFSADSSLNITNTYDVAPTACNASERFPVGRLSKTVDASGSTEYCYDWQGRLTRKIQILNGRPFVQLYGYSKAGRVSSVVYPSGVRVDYGVSPNGGIGAITLTRPAQTSQKVLLGVEHYPFGPAKKITFGNGRILARTYDLNYSPTAIQDASTDGLSLGYSFNEVGDIAALRQGNLSNPPVRRYQHDSFGQLTAMKSGSDAQLKDYIYNPYSLSRTTEVTNGATSTTATYDSATGRLIQWNGKARAYDASGNTISNGGSALEFVYNSAGRVSAVKVNGATAMSYKYNAKGERVQRQGAFGLDYSTYDLSGRFLGRYDSAGKAVQEVIWLADTPVSVDAGGKLYYVEADHLGTPRVVIDPARQKAVWKWDAAGSPFGGDAPNQDPDQDGTPFVFDLRFPGQQFDSVSGTHYNIHRDYDPSTGTYLQSDPLGILGGMNTYNYVSNSPLIWGDPLGLLQWNELPTQELWGRVTRGATSRTFPGDGLAQFEPGSLARTTIDWAIKPQCKCSEGQFRLDEFIVDVGVQILLRTSYSTQTFARQTVTAEYDHVRDLRSWMSRARRKAEKKEQELRRSVYMSEADCLTQSKNGLQKFLQGSVKPAVLRSKKRYDEGRSPAHAIESNEADL